MGYKDPEKQREAQKEQMRRRRAQAKTATKADCTSQSAVGTLSTPASIEPQASPTPTPAPATQIDKMSQSVPAVPKTPEEIAQEVGQRTKEILATKGWCLWKASLLDNDTIVVIRDESVTDYPKGYPIYTDDEMREVAHMNLLIIERVHYLKKISQVQILPGFEDAVKGG